MVIHISCLCSYKRSYLHQQFMSDGFSELISIDLFCHTISTYKYYFLRFFTARKVSVFRVFLVCVFPHTGIYKLNLRIQYECKKNSEYRHFSRSEAYPGFLETSKMDSLKPLIIIVKNSILNIFRSLGFAFTYFYWIKTHQEHCENRSLGRIRK